MDSTQCNGNNMTMSGYDDFFYDRQHDDGDWSTQKCAANTFQFTIRWYCTMAFGEQREERDGEYRPVRMHRASADKHFSIDFCRVDVALGTRITHNYNWSKQQNEFNNKTLNDGSIERTRKSVDVTVRCMINSESKFQSSRTVIAPCTTAMHIN